MANRELQALRAPTRAGFGAGQDGSSSRACRCRMLRQWAKSISSRPFRAQRDRVASGRAMTLSGADSDALLRQHAAQPQFGQGLFAVPVALMLVAQRGCDAPQKFRGFAVLAIERQAVLPAEVRGILVHGQNNSRQFLLFGGRRGNQRKRMVSRVQRQIRSGPAAPGVHEYIFSAQAQQGIGNGRPRGRKGYGEAAGRLHGFKAQKGYAVHGRGEGIVLQGAEGQGRMPGLAERNDARLGHGISCEQRKCRF